MLSSLPLCASCCPELHRASSSLRPAMHLGDITARRAGASDHPSVATGSRGALGSFATPCRINFCLRVCVCACACVCAHCCVCVRVWVCMCVRVRACVGVRARTHVCASACVRVCVCACLYVLLCPGQDSAWACCILPPCHSDYCHPPLLTFPAGQGRDEGLAIHVSCGAAANAHTGGNRQHAHRQDGRFFGQPNFDAVLSYTEWTAHRA